MYNTRRLLRGSLTLAAAALTALYLGAAVSAAETQSGWIREGSRRAYLTEEGIRTVGIAEIDGTAYLFAPNGIQQVGWQTVGGKRLFYDPETGEPVYGFVQWRGAEYYISEETGKCTALCETSRGAVLPDAAGILRKDTWISADGAWYYADADGILAESERTIDSIPCLFDEAHALKTGWQTAADGITRYYDPAFDAAEIPLLRTGWLTAEGSTYYADAQRGRLTGLETIGSDIYYFDAEGIMQTGFFTVDAEIRYFDEEGRMQTGWHIINGNSYYFAENGVMQTGIATVDGEIYCFDDDGIGQTGWQTVNECRYYFGADARAYRGMQEIDGDTYYFDNSGIMQTGSVDLGVHYYFDAEGKRIDGWHSSDSGMTYTDPLTGTLAVGWQTVDGDTYYFDSDGLMAVGIVEIDGKRCRFRENGVYAPVKICLDAGHFGKYNRSPVNSNYWESDFTWTMHLYLKAELEKYGIEVITTREDKDTDLGLEDRGRMSAGCDLFLSIHSNAAGNTSIDAPVACCTITGVCDQLGLDLANVVADTMGTYQRGMIWKRAGEKYPDLDYYGVLRGATYVGTPAILLEHSFHTNLRATNWLLQDLNIRKLAAAEGEFLARYYSMID